MSTDLAPTAPAPAAVAASHPLSGRPGRVLLVVALGVCLAGVVAGVASGPLWLDETISVEIAHRPLPALLSALRHDGSPPLYYLLLHVWTSVLGTSTVAVRLLTALLVPVALALSYLLARRLGGRGAGVAAVVVLSGLPWLLRFGSETRMYLLVAVLVLAGALALLAVRASSSWRPVVGLALCAVALLLTHYWAAFLLATVAAWHAPGVLRRRPDALRVAAALVLGGVLFLPQVPTFLYQSAHTGAPWASRPSLGDLLRTPLAWGNAHANQQWALALVLVPLVVLGAVRSRGARAAALVATGTLAVAWTVSHVAGGAYVSRYTAVALPLVAVAAAVGAATLPGRWGPGWLAVLLVVGAVTGLPYAAGTRAPSGKIAHAFLARAQPADLLVYCPDQVGPPTARIIGPRYDQVVYPTLGRPDLVDWVDYAQRNRAASPADVAARIDALAAGRHVFLEKASGYRTFRHGLADDCNQLLRELGARRGAPERLYGKAFGSSEQLYLFPGT